ncbi:hypothetical protein PFICI_01272 [Pestalotiopsis fici W106-1]|uniref:Metallo-beta-lactamase domain-containing protein n=1 Tax=Pestalotiopsis fici (strain W106-1 / CGMCC3.15140) TaxID=1229662 RepID=W3XN76_PESFW|nr:uncharacterized protein PFICI_01272 [Pestalotiopsis fici W106-1]ETS87444.1 hypothetical protein PFICI_01272 [Pestalotiopsis fici W106-1]
MPTLKRLRINTSLRRPLLQEHESNDSSVAHSHSLPIKKTHTHPQPPPRAQATDGEDGSVYFIGTATTVIEWSGMRILTDPNFLHAGDHVHLGPGVTAQRRTNPAVELAELPPVDLVLLSHYHEDHFDREVERRLSRDFPIVTTPHARRCLTDGKDRGAGDEGGPFREVHELDFWESLLVHVDGGAAAAVATATGHEGVVGAVEEWKKKPVVKVTGMPGKHVPPGPLSAANDLLSAVPPTNGWMLELGYQQGDAEKEGAAVKMGYRTYISGDTLFVDELKDIPRWLKDERIDLMLVHLGGTTIPGPSMPLLMVTMDAAQGLQLMRLVNPDLTIPIHYDDYSVFLSPLSDFKDKVSHDGWDDRVVYLDRGEIFRFHAKA